ncbi:MAG TPA: TadE/TadG family type IV pilus assembly protein [Acidobacteriaceae bacterium]|nr:TadE/TadG family type IV pilus assembly protein [Acidobacteriaceae bacterium]
MAAIRQPAASGALNAGAMGSEEGSTLIEFALTFTVLLTLIFCLMELCLVFYSYDMISDCAREGTRYAVLRGASCPTTASPTCEATASQVNSYVSSNAPPNLGAGTLTVATTYPDGNESVGSRVQVKVSYVFPIKMPFVPKASLNMSSTSVMYILQ